MKTGVFTVGLPDLTPKDAAYEIANTGYDGVEWRVTHVPAEVKSEEPSFWGNNLCTLEPTLEEARRAQVLCDDANLDIVGLGTYISMGDVAATEDFSAARPTREALEHNLRFVRSFENSAGSGND